jgi:ArsR family transcriptional regulator
LFELKNPMQIDSLRLFKCLSDDTRLQIILLIQSQGELNVGELVEAMGSSQPKISRHLASLRECQLLQVRKSGQWVFYRIHDELPNWANEIICQAVLAGEETLKQLTVKLNLVSEIHRKPACC